MMRRCPAGPALAMLALGAVAAAAGAATPVYRCGNTYSQTPCEDGRRLEASDARSAAQRAEAQHAAEREQSLAARLAKDRLSSQPRGPAVASGFDARPPTPQQAAAASSARRARERERDAPRERTRRGAGHPAKAASAAVFLAPGLPAR